ALKLIRDGSVTGGGTLTGGKGRFDLQVANLDLNAFVAQLRPMRLGGPLGVTLASPRDPERRGGHITLDHPAMRDVTAL
ncbi:hypothetical protein SB778_46015, partial [Paraburkholderia sp. SIMBA_050]